MMLAKRKNRSWNQKSFSQPSQGMPPSGGISFVHFNSKIMLEAFIDYLDLLYYPGYGENLQDRCPDVFYQQFVQFIGLYR
jgi:hypothetical protein